MKALATFGLVILASGCTTSSRFAHDPRAAVVGPDYLDVIVENPRDRSTQFYYPDFTIRDLADWTDPYANSPKGSFGQGVDDLLIPVPEPTQEAKQATGKGWPRLEHTGIPF